MARKVIRKKIKFQCTNCKHVFDMEDSLYTQRERVPFSARSSSSTLICPKCESLPNGTGFTVILEYKQYYRHRCVSCGKMFDAYNTWENRCSPCEDKYIRALSRLGT